jgi:hypothetical protein
MDWNRRTSLCQHGRIRSGVKMAVLLDMAGFDSYNICGRLKDDLFDENLDKGTHSVVFEARNLYSGT